MKRIVSVFAVIAISCSVLKAQITGVSYYLKYNETTTNFDAMLKIVSGSTTTAFSRLAGNAQFSFVVPTGASVSLISSTNPIRDIGGVAPWVLGTATSNPASSLGNDFYPVTPNLSPTARYSTLVAGQEIVLFSLKITGTTKVTKIRMWDNATDPNPADAGMNGRQFDNGFTMGGATQRYITNDPCVYPAPPRGTNNVKTTGDIGIVPISGGVAINNVAFNDKINSLRAELGINASIFELGNWLPGITLDTFSGSVRVAPGTPAGSYEMSYKICDLVNEKSICTNQNILVFVQNVLSPKELINFSANPLEGNAVLVNWNTNLEINSDVFEIERSLDGANFEKIGLVKTKAIKGNSTTKLDYSFIDKAAVLGNNFYRLRQYDLDGSSSFSNVVIANIAENGLESSLNVFPNPTFSFVNFTNSNKDQIENVLVYDLNGKFLGDKQNFALNGNSINLNSLISNEYQTIFKLASGKTVAKKIIKY